MCFDGTSPSAYDVFITLDPTQGFQPFFNLEAMGMWAIKFDRSRSKSRVGARIILEDPGGKIHPLPYRLHNNI